MTKYHNSNTVIIDNYGVRPLEVSDFDWWIDDKNLQCTINLTESTIEVNVTIQINGGDLTISSPSVISLPASNSEADFISGLLLLPRFEGSQMSS